MTWKRIVVLCAVLVLSSAIIVPHVAAQGGTQTNVDVAAEVRAIDSLLQQSMRAYRLKDYEKAYKLSRAAYLDHFENIEIPLRVADSDLTLDMEYRFAELRTKMEAGAPSREVEAAVGSVRAGLDEIEAMFTNMGVLAPILAFTASFTIIFREGLEAVLIIAALLGYLRSGANRQGRRYVVLGIVLALVATGITWVLLRFVLHVTPVSRELLEAVVSLVAVVMLFWVSFWLFNRLDREHWMEFLRARAWAAMTGGSVVGLVGLGFTAVYREGFETVLFYEVLFGMSRRAETYVLYGLVAGLAALGVIAWLILRAGRRLPIRTFMQIAVSVIILLSIAFIGQSVRELQEAGFVSVTSLIGVVPRLPRVLADFTGIHPTVETLLAQIGLTGVYVLGGAAMWWRTYLQQQRTPEALNT